MEQLKTLITDNDTWSGAEGENNGLPFLLRFRPHLQEFINSGDYTNRLVISWDYTSDHDSLMPTEQDLELMTAVENCLVDTLEADLQAILAFVYTGQNLREWQWYSKNLDETINRLNEALSDFEKLPIELTAEDDPDWNEYNAVLEGTESESNN